MQVTFFWNGNRSGTFNDKLETYYEVRHDGNLKANAAVTDGLKHTERESFQVHTADLM